LSVPFFAGGQRPPECIAAIELQRLDDGLLDLAGAAAIAVRFSVTAVALDVTRFT